MSRECEDTRDTTQAGAVHVYLVESAYGRRSGAPHWRAIRLLKSYRRIDEARAFRDEFNNELGQKDGRRAVIVDER